MNQIFHQAGFLGTHANLATDITLVVGLLVATLFTIGVVMAVQGRYQVHRWIQTSAATLNAIFVLWMMILPFRDFVARDFMGSRPPLFYYVTSLHALIGFFGLTLGVFVVLRANKIKLIPKALRFNNYKLFMRVSYSLYMLATLVGLGVYLVWFVVIPNPPTF
jgi:uncharacterized membrane protein YozB (DUF420 family)